MRKKDFNKCGRSLLIALLMLISASHAWTQPVMPGFNMDVYANIIKPSGLAFDPDGILYVGNNTSNTDPIKIRRIGLGGSPIEAYGNTGLIGPDNVAFDASGSISGQPGSVLVAGIEEWSGGRPYNAYIAAILPDESIKIIFTGSPLVAPQDMAFDRYGRLLIGDFPGLFVTTGQALALLTPPGFNYVSSANSFSIDGGGRIFFSNEVGPPYDTIEIRIVNADGTLLDEPFLSFTNTGNQKLSFSPFDAIWNGNLLTHDHSGIFRRIDARGNVNIFGSGIGGLSDIVFGPDGALYVSDTDDNVIYRIVPFSRIQNPDNGHWYQRFDDTMTWHDAKTHCENLSGYLATITSQIEHDFVYDNLGTDSPHKMFWLGATDEQQEGAWEWVTGESWNYTNWAENEPDNCSDNEHYLMIFTPNDPYGRAGFWNDIGEGNDGGCGCGDCIDIYRQMSTICEWEPQCKADINNDGDVDGEDLAELVVEFGRTDCP